MTPPSQRKSSQPIRNAAPCVASAGSSAFPVLPWRPGYKKALRLPALPTSLLPAQSDDVLYQILVYTSGMERKIYLAPHLTTEELQQQYKVTPRAADARRYHALWLISQGHTALAAAQIVGLSEKWVRTLVQRYHDAGPVGLRDQRTDNPGKAPLLTPVWHTLG